jgi:hypothetical protein
MWQKYKFRPGLAIPAFIAGLIYNSWIIGYWLNPVVARHGLASELEGLHQPYSWLFIAGDVACSLLIGLVAIMLRTEIKDRLLRLALLAVGGFSLFTIIDALLPIRCDPTVQSCPSFRHDRLLFIHGVCSILASIFLFVSVVLVWWGQRRNRLIQGIIVGYILFSIFSFIAVFTPGQSNWSQHYYLILCGVWLGLLPSALLGKPSNN